MYLVYVCKYVYHESAYTWHVYMFFHIFLLIPGIENDYGIRFISRTKV